jgi:hypothetical protein
VGLLKNKVCKINQSISKEISFCFIRTGFVTLKEFKNPIKTVHFDGR